MSAEKHTNPWPAIAIVIIAAALFAPSLKGCAPQFHGLEIATWLGKLKVRPITPPKPIEPPKARCLVFGFDSCGGCKEQYKIIRRELVPHGWKFGPSPDADFETIDVYSADPRVGKFKPAAGWTCPALVIIDTNDRELARRVGPLKGADLRDWLQTYRK